MLTADEAAARLGIKIPSLYAYVSRGLVERHTTADGRSMFDAGAIESMASRGRPRVSSRESSLNLLIETSLTRIDSHRIWFRGHEVIELASSHSFEQVAELLWTGDLGERHAPWIGTPVTFAPGPDGGALPMGEALRIAAAYAAVADPFRGDLEPAAVAGAGRHLVATMVDSLGPPSRRAPRLTIGGVTVARSIAGRLWNALAPQRPADGMLEVLNAVLVLLADHELAASTLGARVAASARADPYAVVGAGLGVLNGPLHGRASTWSRRLLDDALTMGATAAITESLRTWRAVPGFGQRLYPAGDPRAVVVMRLLRDALGNHRSLANAEAVVEAFRSRTDQHPNVDFTLGVLTQAARMPPDAGEVIFAVARTAGWLAHAIEEYAEPPLRFRPRAAFVDR